MGVNIRVCDKCYAALEQEIGQAPHVYTLFTYEPYRACHVCDERASQWIEKPVGTIVERLTDERQTAT